MTTNLQHKINIKGVREGLLVTLGEGDWPELEASVLQSIEERGEFFQGARMAVDAGELVLRAGELGSLREKLSGKGITLWAVLGNSAVTEQNAQALGLATQLQPARVEEKLEPLDTHLPGETCICLRRTLRSGFRVEYNGHVVIYGDVNPGAEIIANGDVIVWGRLRGVVHAGAGGDEQAVVCSLDLMPTQLRIGNYIAVTPKRKGKPVPEVARILKGQVVAEPWDQKEGK